MPLPTSFPVKGSSHPCRQIPFHSEMINMETNVRVTEEEGFPLTLSEADFSLRLRAVLHVRFGKGEGTVGGSKSIPLTSYLII